MNPYELREDNNPSSNEMWWKYLLTPPPAVTEIQGVDSEGKPYTVYQYTFVPPCPTAFCDDGNWYMSLPYFSRRRMRARKRPERMSKKWREKRRRSKVLRSDNWYGAMTIERSE